MSLSAGFKSNIERPTSNVEPKKRYPAPRSLHLPFDVQCSMFVSSPSPPPSPDSPALPA